MPVFRGRRLCRFFAVQHPLSTGCQAPRARYFRCSASGAVSSILHRSRAKLTSSLSATIHVNRCCQRGWVVEASYRLFELRQHVRAIEFNDAFLVRLAGVNVDDAGAAVEQRTHRLDMHRRIDADGP
jgi:hypothetical protein